MLPPPPCPIAKTEVFFYNSDIIVVSAIVLASLGYILVHYFVAGMLLHFSVSL